jgi:hypothetical protein
MVLRERIELSTSPLPRECSTTELPQPAWANAADFCHTEFDSASTVWPAREGTAPAFDKPSGRASHEPGLKYSHAPRRGRLSTTKKPAPNTAEARKARLAEQLRANLQRRKQQARSRREGAADEREEGIATTRSATKE